MADVGVQAELDVTKFSDLLDRLDGKEMKKVLRKVVNSGGMVLKNETIKQLKAIDGIKTSSGKTRKIRATNVLNKWTAKRFHTYDALATRIHIKWHADKLESVVNIMGGRNYPMLRWLELGTQDRWIYRQDRHYGGPVTSRAEVYKQGKNRSSKAFRGGIRAFRFFQKANMTSKNRQSQKMEQVFSKQIKILELAKGVE